MAKPRYKIEIISTFESVRGPSAHQNQGSSQKYCNIYKDGTWYLQNPSPEQLADFLSSEFGFEVEEIIDSHTETHYRAGSYVRPMPKSHDS